MRNALLMVLPLLLVIAASSASGAPTPAEAGRKALDKLGWTLACQAYTFREMSLFETLDTLKSLGITAVEMYPGQALSKDDPTPFDHNASPDTIKKVLARCKANDIKPISFGVTGTGETQADARKLFAFAKAMGLQTIVAEPAPEELPLLDKLSKEYGIRLAIHNHPAPSRYWNPATVAAAIKPCTRMVGACADDGHWYRSGIKPVEGLKLLDGRIIELHFKDLSADKHDVPWGTGVCDLPAQLRELKRQVFKGAFVTEYESTTGAELVANVAKCRDWLYAEAVKMAAEK
jgi:sugar phosphate isomerase/epimerase